MSVPVIQTNRLTLRAHGIEDFAACAAMWADPAVTRYIGGRPSTSEEVWGRLLRYAGHWALLGFGYWALVEKSSGEFVGELGFADFHRDMHPAIDVPELGWALVSRVHGQGYGTEAVSAALRWGDEHFNPSRTVCLIHPDNAASIRVAGKCGYRQWRPMEYKGQPTLLFDRP